MKNFLLMLLDYAARLALLGVGTALFIAGWWLLFRRQLPLAIVAFVAAAALSGTHFLVVSPRYPFRYPLRYPWTVSPPPRSTNAQRLSEWVQSENIQETDAPTEDTDMFRP